MGVNGLAIISLEEQNHYDHHHVGKNTPKFSLTSDIVENLLEIGKKLLACYLINTQWSDIYEIYDMTSTHAPIAVHIYHKTRKKIDTTSMSDVISSQQE